MTHAKKKNGQTGRMTMHDVARRAGVSIGTVSNVTNGKQAVSNDVRARVKQAIEELGYQPNQLSRALRIHRTNIIGMVIPDITNPFFPSVVRGVEDVAFNANYRLLLCNADNDVAKETAYLNDLRSLLPAGIILIPSLDHPLPWSETYPLVCIDRRPLGWVGDSVTVENREGGRQAGGHLASMGHRIIGIVRGPANVNTANERVNGFNEALEKAKIHIAPVYIQQGSFDQESGYLCTMRLLRLVPRPTAIFAVSDLQAVGAISAVKASKLRCPEDVSVLGFDGLSLAEVTEPALTTVVQPSYQLGHAAATLLLERIHGDGSAARNILLPTELKIRDSVQSVAEKSAVYE